MGRESSALEPAALSFLSAVDTDLGLDAVLFLRRTGLVLASWTREGIRLDIVSVMAATMLASIDKIVEAGRLGPPSDPWDTNGLDNHADVGSLGMETLLIIGGSGLIGSKVAA